MAEPCGGYTYKGKQYETKEKLIEFLNSPKGRAIAIKDAETISKQKEDIKELKAHVQDVFKAGVEGAKIIKATAKTKLLSITGKINEMASKGKVTSKQAKTLITRLGKLNLNNEDSVSKFVDYADNVFNNAEYKDKIDTAEDTVSSIKGKLSNKNIDAELKDLAKKFASIDPNKVLDIDTHTEIASNLNDNIVGSTSKGSKVKIAESIDRKALAEYIDKEIKNREESDREDLLDSFADGFFESSGIDPKDISKEDLQDILDAYNSDSETSKPLSENKEKALKEGVSKAFNTFSAIVKDIVSKGFDSLTGEDVNLSSDVKSKAEALTEIDLDLLSTNEKLVAVDILNDIIVNGESKRIDAFLDTYEGKKSASEFSKGKSASKLKLFFSEDVGRFWNKRLSDVYKTAETMFRGFTAGGDFMKATGFPEFQKGVNKGLNKVLEFSKKKDAMFFNTKPNGEAYNTHRNIFERGIAAQMIRYSEGAKDSDFSRKKALVEQTIAELKKGNKKEVADGLVAERVYNEVFKDCKNAEEVLDKMDPDNRKAVEFVIDNYRNNYAEKADVALKYYNSKLNEDNNYTPTSYSRLSGQKSSMEENADAFDSAIIKKEGKVYDKKSGTFMETTENTVLPKGMTLDFNFDRNVEKSMKAEAIDVNTASTIKKMKAFLYSPDFENIIPDAKDRELFINKIKKFVDIKRGRNFMDSNQDDLRMFSNISRKVSRLSAIKALGGVTAAFKQTIPVGFSTLINSGRLDIIDAFDSDWNTFLANSGYDIANRGIHSLGDIKEIQGILDKAAETKGERFLEAFEKQQEMLLKVALGKPDVFIARASWISYYKEGLAKQGIDISDIDIKSHKINDDAAYYAQRQVDRQQNPSDEDLGGDWLTSKNPSAVLSRTILLPFARFGLNQKSRMYSDIHTLTSKTSSAEDVKIARKSLIGLSIEQAVFRAISASISAGIYAGTSAALGYEEPEKKKKERLKRVYENQLRNITTDYLSPVPFLDYFALFAANELVDNVQDLAGVDKGKKIDLEPYMDRNYMHKFGMFGSFSKSYVDMIEYEKLALTGEYTKNGRKRKLSEEKMEKLQWLQPVVALYNVGLLPAEFNTVINDTKKIVKEKTKRKVKTTVLKLE
jgi:hypothetical protein